VLRAQVVLDPLVTEARGAILTGTVTVTGMLLLTPSDVAVTEIDPAETPVRSPVASTVAISVFEEVHVTTRSVTIGAMNAFPVLTIADNWNVVPTATLALFGLTSTL
jgi:hypothetical protein